MKTATIDKLVREQEALEAEQREAEARQARDGGGEEHRYEVLQSECAHITREFLATTQRLEQQVDKLRAEKHALLNHAE